MNPARQPLGRRLVTAILGIDRRPVRRELPLGRRILASALGIDVRPPLRSRRDSAPARRPVAPQASSRGGSAKLLTEDRPAFERLLDTVLHDAAYTTGTGRGRPSLDPELLREIALGASAQISASASAEYERYVMLRSERRGVSAGGAQPGLGAVMAVLAPVLAGAAAVLFLLVGYLLQLLDPDPSLASYIRRTGWIFALFTAAAIVVAMAALLVTALRSGDPPTEVDRARDEWQEALLERGIRPFLAEVADVMSEAGGANPAVPRDFTVPRTPRLGYSRPAFTSPDDRLSTEGPRFSSPDYTGPDFGGGERDQE